MSKNVARKGSIKGTNLTRKGKYSSTLMEPVRNRARDSSYHYSLGRPKKHFFRSSLFILTEIVTFDKNVKKIKYQDLFVICCKKLQKNKISMCVCVCVCVCCVFIVIRLE